MLPFFLSEMATQHDVFAPSTLGITTMFNKKQPETTIDNIIRQARALPRATGALQGFENASTWGTPEVCRVVALWRQANDHAMNYTGPDAESLLAEIDRYEQTRKENKVLASTIERKLIQQYGEHADPSVEIDAAPVELMQEANRNAYAAGKAADQAREQLRLLRKSEQVQHDAALILAALIGVEGK